MMQNALAAGRTSKQNCKEAEYEISECFHSDLQTFVRWLSRRAMAPVNSHLAPPDGQ